MFAGYDYYRSESETDSDDDLYGSRANFFSPLFKSLMETMRGESGEGGSSRETNDIVVQDLDLEIGEGGCDVEMIVEKTCEEDSDVYSSDFEEESEESEEEEVDGDFAVGQIFSRYVRMRRFDEFCRVYYAAKCIRRFFGSIRSAALKKKHQELLVVLLNQAQEASQRVVLRQEKMRRFDKFCHEYYAARCIIRFLKRVKVTIQKRKHQSLLKSLLRKEQEKLAAARAREEYLSRKNIHESIMVDLRAADMARATDREKERLIINLERRKAEMKMMLDEEEAKWDEDVAKTINERKMRIRRDKRKRLDLEAARNREMEAKKARELELERERAIMREQERRFFERQRKAMIEQHIQDRLDRISERESDELNSEMRLKLKAVADGWKERHKLNRKWENIRSELVKEHHRKQFRPVLDNLVRFNSFKENSDKWIVVADELRERVERVEAVGGEGDLKKDGGCIIM